MKLPFFTHVPYLEYMLFDGAGPINAERQSSERVHS